MTERIPHGSFSWHRNSKRILSFLALLLCFWGCGLFKTRTPESPTEYNATYPLATTPQQLLDNFRRSLIEGESVQYLQCFVDASDSAYRFRPAADAVALYPELFTSWSIASEQIFISRYSATFGSSSIALHLQQPVFEQTAPDSALIQSPYQFTYFPEFPNIPDTVAGTMKLRCVRDANGIWSIIEWFDQNNSTFPSFSMLKALLLR